jgi:Peptidase family U32
MSDVARQALSRLGLAPERPSAAPDSPHRFPDGAQYRVEIPSVEGPRCLETVLEQASELEVTVLRVSQGSGVFLHTSAELHRMARLASDAGIEASLFVRPTGGWGLSASARSSSGSSLAGIVHGHDQLVAAIDDIRRAADHGFRSVLIGDVGLLDAFREIRSSGMLPRDMRAKVSVTLGVANPAAARVLERLGASTLNIATDLTIEQIAAIRAAISIPLDIYVEAPDNLGGFIRHHDIPEIVRVAAPVYLKFGLRNAPDVYPSGSHLEELTVKLSAERVRRARLGLDILARDMPHAVASTGRPADLAIPLPVG